MFRLDTSKSQSSPLRHSTTTAAAASVDRSSSRDRTNSARRTSSPAGSPAALGKFSPALGRSSPAASPLVDSSRRRRAADHWNSPRHTTDSSVGGLTRSPGCAGSSRGQSSAIRNPARFSDSQSESVSSPANTRLKATTSEEHPLVHPAARPAPPRFESTVVKSRPERRVGGAHCNADDSNGNCRQRTKITQITSTTAVPTTTSADDDVAKLHIRKSCTSTDAGSAAQVRHLSCVCAMSYFCAFELYFNWSGTKHVFDIFDAGCDTFGFWSWNKLFFKIYFYHKSLCFVNGNTC